MARRLPRAERAAYRRDDACMARINEATTWKTRLEGGMDYLKAALTARPDLADQVAEEAALHLAEVARQITFRTDGRTP